MTSGIPFSDREKAYIVEHAPTRPSWGALAAALVREFPEDGGGSRDGKSVRNWHRRYMLRAGKMSEVKAEVPIDLAVRIRHAGLSPAEIGLLVAVGLSGGTSVSVAEPLRVKAKA